MGSCRKKTFWEKGVLFALVVFLGTGWLAGCSNEPKVRTLPLPAAQMNTPEYTIGVAQGTTAMSIVEARFPKSRIEYHMSLHDGYLAVQCGKIDAFAFDRHSLQYVAAHNPELALLPEKIGDERIVVGTALGKEALIGRVNDFIRQYRSDGTYADMYRRWIMGQNPKMPDLPKPARPAITLVIGTDGRNEPMNFYENGRLAGFDIEFAERLALFLNAKPVYHTIDFPAVVSAAATGKIDLLVSSLNATPERRRMMLFSDPYIDSEISFLARADRLPFQTADITRFSQLAGRKVGIITGSTYDRVLKKSNPGAVPEYFQMFADQAEALRSGKIAAFLVDEPIARDIMNRTEDLTILPDRLTSDGYAFAFSRRRPDLRRQFNEALEEMRTGGALRKIDAKWFGKNEADKVLPDLKTDGSNGVIRLATNSGLPPFAYIRDGQIVGYDIEIAMTIAAKFGWTVEISDMEVAAILPSLISGKSDMAACGITITEERSRSVLFSAPTYKGGIAVMVKAEGKASKSAAKGGPWARFVESFQRTFLVEKRYEMVLQGLRVTIIITLLSAFFGTLLGFGICMMRRAQTRWANLPARIFIRAVQGTPIIVLLMILYYIVFGSTNLDAIVVAVIGFSINFAAYVSEMMRTGMDAVDRGQQEAAYALGFNRVQVFQKITFPQAARHALPVFKGEFVSMLKMTSVVGYIAIQDLTKMSDIIRSRTYEAFFPLIATALIYFVMAYLMAGLLSLVEIRVDPKRRKRAVKGGVRP